MTKKIAIIGAGLAGLHLGLYLRKYDIEATIYTDRRPEAYRDSGLLNTVTHHADTIARESFLGVNHWPAEDYGYFSHWHHIGVGPEPLFFEGKFTAPSRAVDYRIYLPRLMEDFEAAGGRIIYLPIAAEDLATLSNEYDLVVVCIGKAKLGQMFGTVPELSPHREPQRRLAVGFYTGLTCEEGPANTTLSISPGQGELIDMPTQSFGGTVHALLFENVPGGDLEELAQISYADNPRQFLDTMLRKLEVHHPSVFRRVDPATFDLAQGPRDLLQGGFTPVVRNGYLPIGEGKFALALGDAQMTVDPLVAQGANTASFSAFVVGKEIVDNDVLDERFCEKVELGRKDRIACATRWTNLFLSGAPHVGAIIGAMSEYPAFADEFTGGFSAPERLWDHIATAERLQKAVQRHVPAPTA